MPPPTRRCGFADPVRAAKGQKTRKRRGIRLVSQGEGDSHPGALYQGSCSTNRLTSSLYSYSHFPSQNMKSRSN